MILRKKRVMFLSISIILLICIVFGILAFLYLKTDMLKSKETLFAKYLMQNFNIVEVLKDEEGLEIENMLNNNKYTSKMEGKIQYTENIETSNENKNSRINDVEIGIKSNVDIKNNYNYKNISISTKNEDLFKLEYLNQDKINGIRLNGIKQFVSIENNDDKAIFKELGIENMKALLTNIKLDTILNFTETEKQSLVNIYLAIIQDNISKDKYYKQSNSLITINNQDVKTNAYYVRLTIEEYNNLYIKILEQITNDDIILSKVDLIENEIKQIYADYNQDNSLREKFISYINNKIEQIKSTNIGSEEIKVIVYENHGKLVRTSIEKTMNKITIDFYNDSIIKIDNKQLGEDISEQSIKLEKNKTEKQSNTIIELGKIKNNEMINNVKFNYQQLLENSQLNKTINLEILNEKYKGIFSLNEDIEFIEEFEEQTILDEDNINLKDLEKDQIEVIKEILDENIKEQLSNLYSIVELQEYTKMLQNLGIIKRTSIQFPDKIEVTDIERKRFNSQFEFFESEDLTADNIKEMMEIVQQNLEDVQILLKNGEIQKLDIDKLNSDNEDSNKYKKDISEILISIKQGSENEKRQKEIIEFIDDNSNYKYTVSLEYNNSGLVALIRVKIQDN